MAALLGSIPGKDSAFCHHHYVILPVVSNQCPFQLKTLAYSSSLNQTECESITCLHLILEFRKRGAIPQLPPSSPYVLALYCLDARTI
jgi:hypothetical protein